MSQFQSITTDQQQQKDIEIDVPARQRNNKSKPKKSLSKKKSIHKSSSNSDNQVEIDKKSIQQNGIIHIKDEQQKDRYNNNSTITKPNHGSLKSSNLNINGFINSTVQKQTKLNYFMRKKGQVSLNSNTNNDHNQSLTSLPNTSSKYAIPQCQRRKSSLQKQLSQKQALIQKLKNQKQLNSHKYTKLKLQSEQYKIQQKALLEQQLKESARMRRQEKAQINPKMGYYKQTSWTVFVQGNFITTAKTRVQKLDKQIKQLQQKRRNARQQQRDRLTYQVDFLLKQKNQALANLKSRQAELSTYKQKLRLADKQASCHMAKRNWQTIYERYLPIELLGSGGFGEVYKCYDLEKNNYVALKMNCFQPTKGGESREEFIKHVQRQVATLKELTHPNIAKLIDEIQIDNKISFIMEYCTGPQLNKYLHKKGFLQEKQARGIIKQIAFALKYMFQQKYRIIHYDLKPANIIFHNGCVKILDFGLCKRMDNEDTKIDLTSQGVGTYWYLPPETFKQYAEISPKVDVWSLGVIFYELLYGKRPFGQGMDQTKIYQQGIILKAIKVQFPTDKKYKVSDEAKQFIKACLKYRPEQRLDPLQVYNHQYLMIK